MGQKIPKDHSTLCDKVLEWTNNFLSGPRYETTTERQTFQVSVQQTQLCIWLNLLSSISLSMMTMKGPGPVHRRSVLTCWHCTSLCPLSPQPRMWPQKQVLLWFFFELLLFPLNGSLQCPFLQWYPTGRQALARQRGEKAGREIKCSYPLPRSSLLKKIWKVTTIYSLKSPQYLIQCHWEY